MAVAGAPRCSGISVEKAVPLYDENRGGGRLGEGLKGIRFAASGSGRSCLAAARGFVGRCSWSWAHLMLLILAEFGGPGDRRAGKVASVDWFTRLEHLRELDTSEAFVSSR